MDQLRADLVFEGGGVKGIALAGAFRELTDRGYAPECVAGTSAGAITAALVAVGYTAEEIEEIVLRQMHFPNFADHTHFGRPGELLHLARTHGLHSGDYFLNWIRELLANKEITRFGQLRNTTTAASANSSRDYRLQVIASDLTGRTMLVLPRDATQLGYDPDELEIAHAVRMSMSIPIFFQPVISVDPRSQTEHVIVDGGLLSNFPVWLFDCPQDQPPAFPTFGMMLVGTSQGASLLPETDGEELPQIHTEAEFLKAIGDTMMQAHDRLYVEEANYARTVPIPTLGVTTTDFHIPPAQAQQLYDSGVQSAHQFFDGWNFDEYIATFRSGLPTSRRQRLAAATGSA
jgi:NTE family protein